MAKVKLYNVENYEYPRSEKVDSRFRTVQVFECRICGSLTNLVERINDSWLGVKQICPNNGAKWHSDLKEKRQWLDSYPHPATYKSEMRKEIIEMIGEIPDEIITEDIAGNPDMKKGKLFF
ncbi:MAG: hypothetical protein HYW34_02325 [Candidatus Brennerbacteria bacterium]|nr:hypothetical protein [Candidatus Brennerbacteria bacterium]